MIESVSETVQRQSIEAFQSVIRKSENALKKMVGKEANTSVIEKRLHALIVSLYILEHTWNGRDDQHYSSLEISEARHVMNNLLPSLKRMMDKSTVGTPQYTLLERRIRAFQLAVQAMEQK
ncbi:hypothetical protein SAMN05720606_102118 [Paenibacillus polysaccharolyticus]|uniref:Uncharacterized protein n=1 Tax=Paenibacillus polysaccharolyticus TaxID=582692 RepID=A0A1G5CK92_9BACL|nr:hypothetical protein [Paenibacillus polysaccharolyticus]SCY02905.1 hypothetical protein SAMN05720606_102118 [Paenibacillus polysaccharolyticus]